MEPESIGAMVVAGMFSLAGLVALCPGIFERRSHSQKDEDRLKLLVEQQDHRDTRANCLLKRLKRTDRGYKKGPLTKDRLEQYTRIYNNINREYASLFPGNPENYHLFSEYFLSRKLNKVHNYLFNPQLASRVA